MLRQTLIATTFALAFTGAQAATPLQMKVYSADDNSFNVSAVVLSGETEAMVIDAGFTRADAYRIAANVLDSGKTLKTILVSNADPDYYFGADVLTGLFPQAKLVAPAAVVAKIKATQQGKVAFWGPKMGVNAPKQIRVPSVLNSNTLAIDGQTVELRGTSGVLAHRPYVWVPSIRAIAGNVAITSGMHVWTADTQKPAERQAWVAQLDEMLALNPAMVVPGHMPAGSMLDASTIRFTRDYLLRFEAEATKAKDSAALIKSMSNAYPALPVDMSLELGAKVIKGETAW